MLFIFFIDILVESSFFLKKITKDDGGFIIFCIFAESECEFIDALTGKDNKNMFICAISAHIAYLLFLMHRAIFCMLVPDM